MNARKTVYLDHAAATPCDTTVLQTMAPFFSSDFANPSALYGASVAARSVVEDARKKVADILFAQPDTIVFTSGGTESINLAILGTAKKRQMLNVKCQMPPHIITTAIEHHAALDAMRHMETEGFDVTYLPVDHEGSIRVEDFKKALRPETALVSIMYANNEIGVIQPIAEVGREILKWRKTKFKVQSSEFGVNWPYFHTDACQAAAYLDLNVEKLHVDLMSVNSSKIYGPKGSGILYKRRGVEIEPLMYGGGQEFGLRSGTENVPGILGFAKALEMVTENRNREIRKLQKLRDYFWMEVQKRVAVVALNGPNIISDFRFQISDYDRLPNNLNITLNGADAEALIIYLDEAGIQCSSGSACTEATDEVSHVLLACGLSEEDARSSLRFTLGKSTTKKDIDYVLKVLPGVVERCRRMKKIAQWYPALPSVNRRNATFKVPPPIRAGG